MCNAGWKLIRKLRSFGNQSCHCCLITDIEVMELLGQNEKLEVYLKPYLQMKRAFLRSEQSTVGCFAENSLTWSGISSCIRLPILALCRWHFWFSWLKWFVSNGMCPWDPVPWYPFILYVSCDRNFVLHEEKCELMSLTTMFNVNV